MMDALKSVPIKESVVCVIKNSLIILNYNGNYYMAEWEIIKFTSYKEGERLFHTHGDIKFSCQKYYKYRCSFCRKVVPKHFILQMKLLEIKADKFSKVANPHLKRKGFFIFQDTYKGCYKIDSNNRATTTSAIGLFPPSLNIIIKYIEGLYHDLENQVQSI